MLNINTTRRGFMQLSATSAALLTVGATAATLTGCSKVPPATGFLVLRASDIEFFAALAPVILSTSYPGSLQDAAQDRLMHALDNTMITLQDYARGQLVMLLDTMQSAPIRVAMGAPWASWNDASADDIDDFLNSWKDSRIGLKRMGYASLCKLFNMSWYSQPETFSRIGYPGFPKHVVING